jgi:hypothetical protein
MQLLYKIKVVFEEEATSGVPKTIGFRTIYCVLCAWRFLRFQAHTLQQGFRHPRWPSRGGRKSECGLGLENSGAPWCWARSHLGGAGRQFVAVRCGSWQRVSQKKSDPLGNHSPTFLMTPTHAFHLFVRE